MLFGVGNRAPLASGHGGVTEPGRAAQVTAAHRDVSPKGLVAGLLFIALVVAAIGSLGAPLITAVAQSFDVSLAGAQWTLTVTLMVGAVATPLLGRLGGAATRRPVVLAALAVVVVGSAATVATGPAAGRVGFALLLAGRGAQGVGLGLTALMMATARDSLGERATGTIALLSVASTAGIGVGYPLAGLLAQLGGVRAAYALGLVVTAAALVIAVRVLPRAPARANGSAAGVDWAGAALLSAGLVAVLLVTSLNAMWIDHPGWATAIAAAGVGLLAAWVAVERRVARPLVDLTALRHPAVAGANLVMFVAGIAMYLLLTVITRFAQTPPAAGYGFGLSAFEAGLVLVPFSAMGFVAGRVAPRLGRRLGPFVLLAGNGVVVTAAFCLFAVARSHLAWPVVAMAVLGVGVGGFSAAMPAAILAVTPPAETAAAMSVNQVVRSVGFSVGSAVGGLLLAASTPSDTPFPAPGGYTVTAWIGAAIAAVSVGAAVLVAVAVRRPARDPDQ